MLAASSRRLPRAWAQNAAVALYSSSLPKPAEGAAEAASVSSACQQPYSSNDLAMVALLMQKDAFQTSRALANALSPAQRVVLAASLKELQQSKPGQVDESYVDELFKAASAGSSDGEISKSNFRAALMAHSRGVVNSRETGRPSNRVLWTLFLASAIPFVAFGFLDNAIMLTAGEEIDHVFGVRLGLTTLASAGLGNCVADVVGVSAAKAIEQAVRTLPGTKDPKISREQNAMSIVRMVKVSGSTAGVMVGCVLGLMPLFVGGTFFR